MSLTQKQEAFCLAYIETGNASEAYRRSYDTSRQKPTSINRIAFKLSQNIKIISRLAELRAPAVLHAQLSLSDHLTTLAMLREQSRALSDMKAAITAEVKRGEASGFYVQKVESGKPGEFNEDRDELKRRVAERGAKLGMSVVPIKKSA